MPSGRAISSDVDMCPFGSRATVVLELIAMPIFGQPVLEEGSAGYSLVMPILYYPSGQMLCCNVSLLSLSDPLQYCQQKHVQRNNYSLTVFPCCSPLEPATLRLSPESVCKNTGVGLSP